ncbi:RidA family protein [Alicycliphilus denitrificans]|uniref:RidA family protein n=1 Tax=Alicycliphilus denitrificans TaxID=179636 RepID=A0A858ZXL4_9BURK|nr:RidA family protein [Alicycliphilus denitrificans]QKD44919.1 RidA family protein [Alicycliphilus denitrificans]
MTDIQRHHTNARMSKIVCHGGLVYLCGQTAKGSPSANGDIAAQTMEVLTRIDTLLAEAGSDRTRLLTVTIYLRDIVDFAGMNAVWEAWLAGQQAGAPARTTIEAAMATESLRVEMTVTAAAGN